MSGLFGFSSHERDIDKHDTSKEKRKPQYYELFGLLAKFASASTIAVILLPLKEVSSHISLSERGKFMQVPLEEVSFCNSL